MDELYFSLNTDLVPHDLVHMVCDEVFEGWFQVACVASSQGEFLAGDLADDTKLDGRGKLALAHEDQSQSPSQITQFLDLTDAQEAALNRLDSLELTADPQSFLDISFIGQVPSGFRVSTPNFWAPRFSPNLNFSYGKSSFEFTLFDVTWMKNQEDLDQLIDKMKQVTELVGSRRVTQIELETDGKFYENLEEWRLLFSELPLSSQ